LLTIALEFRVGWDDGGVGFNFRGGDRDQLFLMPPSVAEWLPEGHLAWFVMDVVGEFDLSGFRERYRVDGRGGAAYDPAVMVAVLVYAYCVGDRSSRRIERRLVEDVAYRVVAANVQPDHATLARFRAEHEAAIEGLFAQVLALCVAAGLVKVGVVALDGTKIEAAAAMSANMDEERLLRAMRVEARRILAEAAAVDAAEDEQFGDARGDELPAELADRSRRLARLREAKARLDEATRRRGDSSADERGDSADGGDTDAGKAAPEGKPSKRPQVNTTDPDSRLLKRHGGFCQGYNAQAVASEDQIVIAAGVTTSHDVEAFETMLHDAQANLVAAGVACPIEALLADAGYYSTANATVDTPVTVYIATRKEKHLPHEPVPAPPDLAADADRAEAELIAHRAAVMERIAAGELTISAAARELGMSWKQTRHWWRQFQRHGIDGLKRQRRANGEGRHPRTRRKPDIRARMEARLSTPHGRALYKRRAQIIEPVFGQIKDPRRIRRFQRRGLTACNSEWKLITATHNLLKLWRASQVTLAG
jgi:transposase/transposase-like protein